MLIALCHSEPETAEETALDAFRPAEDPGCRRTTLWLGQHLKMRAVLRDGTQLHVGLSLTECVSLHKLLDDDLAVRRWSEIRLRSVEARDDETVPALAGRGGG